MPSNARIALTENLMDVEALLKLHGEQGGNAPGRRFGLEVLNKSAIVLITSYWEAYCEDIAEEGLECLVTHANQSDALPKEIKKIIAKELKATTTNSRSGISLMTNGGRCCEVVCEP